MPSVGSSNPAIMRSVVVLPHPDGPSIVKNWPLGMSRSISRTAVKSPKRLVTRAQADARCRPPLALQAHAACASYGRSGVAARCGMPKTPIPNSTKRTTRPGPFRHRLPRRAADAPIPLSEASSRTRLRGERMATTPQAVHDPQSGAASDLQEKARRHLWMHFTRMGGYDEGHEIPLIVRGEGSYVYDEHGNRYMDGLSALFCVNAGHGRAELGEAAARQAKELGFYTNWSYAHPDGGRAGGADRGARPGRPQPRVLHVRRLGGGGVRLEDGAPVPQAERLARASTRSSRARPPTTAPPSARSRSPASLLCALRSSRSYRARTTRPTRTTTAGPRTATRSGPRTRSST